MAGLPIMFQLVREVVRSGGVHRSKGLLGPLGKPQLVLFLSQGRFFRRFFVQI